jgi:hypothetical protein
MEQKRDKQQKKESRVVIRNVRPLTFASQKQEIKKRVENKKTKTDFEKA